MRRLTLLYLLAAAAACFCHCTNRVSTQNFLDSTFYVGVLKITPESTTAPVNANVTFLASGGVAPYTYSITNNAGTINSATGVFTNSISDVSTIVVKDSAGSRAIAIVSTYVPGQTPAGVAGLQRWYKADSIGAPGTFTSWPDSSGNGFALTGSATQVSNVYNSQPTARFSGANNFAGMALTTTQNTTAFLVATPSSTAASYIVYGNGPSGEPSISSNRGLPVGTTGRAYELDWTETASDRQVFAGTSTGLNLVSFVRIHGSIVTGYYNSFQTINMGAVAGFGTRNWLGFSPGVFQYNGDICEFLIFNVALSDTTRQAIECHLMQKYGIASGALICK